METTNTKTTLLLTAVYDSKVKQHLSPFTTRTTEEALRSFAAAAKKEDHEFNKFAEDFTLWVLGEYCPETGEINPKSRFQIASASDYTKQN